LLLCAPGSIKSVKAEPADNALQVEIVGAENKDPDSASVLNTFKKLMRNIELKNMDQVGACLSPDVIVFDSRNHNLVSGKDAVLNHISNKIIGTANSPAVKTFVVYDPFVDVKGDTAMVSFRAVKTLTGGKDTKFESWCSEIFERKDNEWKVLYFKSSWKPLSGKT
jgi:ketosteroid isomerase-like protein